MAQVQTRQMALPMAAGTSMCTRRETRGQTAKVQELQLCSLPLFGDHARQFDLEDYLSMKPQYFEETHP
jgi:hypothetical protein